MASKWSIVFFFVFIAMITGLNVSVAAAPSPPPPPQPTLPPPARQTTHWVGDYVEAGFGWNWGIPMDGHMSYGDDDENENATFSPPADLLGATVYSTWASSETFIQGDVLVFIFTTGVNNVAEVSKTSYESCNSIRESPITLVNERPAWITLNSAGEHYYISTFPGDCDAGAKLAINVTAVANYTFPPPQSTPSSPASVPLPSTTPHLSDVVGAPPPSDYIAPAVGYVTPPSPPSPRSASKFVVALVMTLLMSIAFAGFY